MAQPKFTKRPSANTMISLPSTVYTSTCGLMVYLEVPWVLFNHAISISLSKWPILHTIDLSRMALKWMSVMIFTFPVAVTKIFARVQASSIVTTSNPSMAACSAQIGSISVINTRAPAPRNDSAEPLPTSPYPATTATFPAIMISVALRMASTKDSLQPYLLSNFDLVTESFTLIAGITKVPFFIRSYKR